MKNENPEIVTMIAIGGGDAGGESFAAVRIFSLFAFKAGYLNFMSELDVI